jgi:hypothetical protein
MEQLQYHHFPSHAQEGVEAIVMQQEIVTTSGASSIK